MKKLLAALFCMGSVAFAQSAPPSPEALAACSQAAEGASCTVTLSDGAHSGICLKAPTHEAASCMPKPAPVPAAVPTT